MFRRLKWPLVFRNAIIAAVAFCIPAYIYIRQADFRQSWLLFLGSGLFFFTMAIYGVRESRKRGGDESTVALIFIAHVTTVISILISCLTCFILLSVLIPGYLSPGNADKVLQNVPAGNVNDKTDGLSFYVFIAATIVNFAAGSIAGITIPFYAKRNQTKDNREPVPLQDKEIEIKIHRVKTPQTHRKNFL